MHRKKRNLRLTFDLEPISMVMAEVMSYLHIMLGPRALYEGLLETPENLVMVLVQRGAHALIRYVHDHTAGGTLKTRSCALFTKLFPFKLYGDF